MTAEQPLFCARKACVCSSTSSCERGKCDKAAAAVSSLRVDLLDEANGGIALLRAAVSGAVVPNLEAEL